MKTEIIERKGKRFAVVPLNDFEQLKDDSAMLNDIRAYDAAKSRVEEAFSSDVAKRLVAGESPIRVFREDRGLTQGQLAKAATIARPYLSEIESGRKRGSISILKSIAAALELDLNDVA